MATSQQNQRAQQLGGLELQEFTKTLMEQHPSLAEQLKEIYEISRRQPPRHSDRDRGFRGGYRGRNARPSSSRQTQPSGDKDALLLIRALLEQGEGANAEALRAFAATVLPESASQAG